MSNITLSVDDDIIKKVRKIAIDKNITLTAMVGDYLTSVAARNTQEKNETIKKLCKSFKKFICRTRPATSPVDCSLLPENILPPARSAR